MKMEIHSGKNKPKILKFIKELIPFNEKLIQNSFLETLSEKTFPSYFSLLEMIGIFGGKFVCQSILTGLFKNRFLIQLIN
jgi:hypothetical protein